MSNGNKFLLLLIPNIVLFYLLGFLMSINPTGWFFTTTIAIFTMLGFLVYLMLIGFTVITISQILQNGWNYKR